MMRYLLRLAPLLLIVLGNAAAAQADQPYGNLRWPGEPINVGREYLTLGRTFEPLMADPRYARFSAAYQYNGGSDFYNHGGVVSFGETLSFVRLGTIRGDVWEFGVQPAVYATFNLADQLDLFNTDYFFSVYTAFRRDRFSLLARTYHDSAHLGDEFLLKQGPDIERDNLVIDGVQVLGSYDIGNSARVYGGGSWYYSKSIESSLQLQWGAEWEKQQSVSIGRPVMAVDVQHLSSDGHDFNPHISVRAGLRFAVPERPASRFEFLCEYYNGRDREGQFIENNVHYVGLLIQAQL